MAEDVEAVVEALGGSASCWWAPAFGGAVVGTYAARHPERLAGLVFADAGGDMRGSPEEEIALYRKGLKPETYEAFTQQWFDATLRQREAGDVPGGDGVIESHPAPGVHGSVLEHGGV
jgi:pimeloyl-ACP methyl ester carboxylesterase